MKPDIADQPSAANPAEQGRRQLLKMAAYVPPAMLGVMISASKMAEAAAIGSTKNCGGGAIIVISAGGMACCPCVPTSTQYNVNSCNAAKCELGNCAACTQVAFTNASQCNKKVAKGGCTCICTPINPAQPKGPATCV